MKKLSPSLEDYLETILRLEKKYRVARVKDIAKSMGVQMPSVTGALKNLREKGLVNYEKNSFISLTDAGVKAAKAVDVKHLILEEFFRDILMLTPEKASEEACGVEHMISGETAERLKHLTQYLKTSVMENRSGAEWTKVLTRAEK